MWFRQCFPFVVFAHRSSVSVHLNEETWGAEIKSIIPDELKAGFLETILMVTLPVHVLSVFHEGILLWSYIYFFLFFFFYRAKILFKFMADKLVTFKFKVPFFLENLWFFFFFKAWEYIASFIPPLKVYDNYKAILRQFKIHQGCTIKCPLEIL